MRIYYKILLFSLINLLFITAIVCQPVSDSVVKNKKINTNHLQYWTSISISKTNLQALGFSEQIFDNLSINPSFNLIKEGLKVEKTISIGFQSFKLKQKGNLQSDYKFFEVNSSLLSKTQLNSRIGFLGLNIGINAHLLQFDKRYYWNNNKAYYICIPLDALYRKDFSIGNKGDKISLYQTFNLFSLFVQNGYDTRIESEDVRKVGLSSIASSYSDYKTDLFFQSHHGYKLSLGMHRIRFSRNDKLVKRDFFTSILFKI